MYYADAITFKFDRKNCFNSLEDYFFCLESQNKDLLEINKYECLDQMYESHKYCPAAVIKTAKEDFIKSYNMKSEFSDIKIKYVNWKVNNLYYLTAKEKKILDDMSISKM